MSVDQPKPVRVISPDILKTCSALEQPAIQARCQIKDMLAAGAQIPPGPLTVRTDLSADYFKPLVVPTESTNSSDSVDDNLKLAQELKAIQDQLAKNQADLPQGGAFACTHRSLVALLLKTWQGQCDTAFREHRWAAISELVAYSVTMYDSRLWLLVAFLAAKCKADDIAHVTMAHAVQKMRKLFAASPDFLTATNN